MCGTGLLATEGRPRRGPWGRRGEAEGAAIGGDWWEIIPLGLMERGLAFTEVVALAALAVPVVHTVAPTPELAVTR
ncbi:hypothetical protein GCM10018954_009630 [Kutzneria kofuensis]